MKSWTKFIPVLAPLKPMVLLYLDEVFIHWRLVYEILLWLHKEVINHVKDMMLKKALVSEKQEKFCTASCPLTI